MPARFAVSACGVVANRLPDGNRMAISGADTEPMNRTLLILTLTAGVLAGCSTRPSTSVDAATVGRAEPTPVVTIAPTTTTTVAPPGWRTCTSAKQGYSIAYPAGWHTDTSGATECRYFDPERVDFTPYSDGFFFALMARPLNVSFEVAARPAVGPTTRTISHEVLKVDGRRAVRYEIEFTDQSPDAYPGGTRLYGYVVDVSGTAFDVSTYWVPGGQAVDQYRAWKQNVDRAVGTLQFR